MITFSKLSTHTEPLLKQLSKIKLKKTSYDCRNQIILSVRTTYILFSKSTGYLIFVILYYLCEIYVCTGHFNKLLLTYLHTYLLT